LPKTVIFGKNQGRRNRFENGRSERADPSCRPTKRAELLLKEHTRASSQPRPDPLYSPSGEIHKLKLAVTNVRERTCTDGRRRRGASPTQATRSAGRAGRSRRVAEFKLELKSKTNLAESVAHKAHRLWDRVQHPACGLVDNASSDFLFG
jgi:hypothetical protein